MGRMAAMMLPLRLRTVPVKKGRTEPLTKYVMMSSLKWCTKDSDGVTILHESMPELCRIHSEVEGMLTLCLQPGLSPQGGGDYIDPGIGRQTLVQIFIDM
jgi:hypothetical protein